jgi:DNA-binding Lrp family transcriptional regulator
VVTAYVLVQTEVGKAAEVAKEVVQIEGVQQAEDVTGPYDVIVRAEARNLDELGKLVVARVQAVDDITRTLTCPVVHLSRCSTPSGIWPTATATATRVDRGGRRRAAASEASRSQTPTNGCELGRQSF